MRLAHERSECDIHGARKGYLAHGKACLKCGLKSRSAIIVHFDTGAEGDYLAHVTFFARAKRVRKVT